MNNENQMSNLKYLIYLDGTFEGLTVSPPGYALEIEADFEEDEFYILQKLYDACRKLCCAWEGARNTIQAELEFYSTTVPESPALFGGHAVQVIYHLEATTTLARSALDIGSSVFGRLWPDPLPSKGYDSFNDFSKHLIREYPDSESARALLQLSDNDASWFRMLCGQARGRSLRDQVAHQKCFPIEYAELRPNSEKEYAVVRVSKDIAIPLPQFLKEITWGPVEIFLTLEREIVRRREEKRLQIFWDE